jgi:hypothetical protein
LIGEKSIENIAQLTCHDVLGSGITLLYSREWLQ